MGALQEDMPQDLGAFRGQLRETAGREARLLAGKGRGDEEALVASACATRLLELLRTLSRRQGEHRWLPLDLVARHGFRGGDADGARAALVKDLAETALVWRSEAPIDPGACGDPGKHFLALRDILAGRRLARAAKRPQSWLDARQRLTVGDVFTTWRRARRLESSRRSRAGFPFPPGDD